VATPDEIKRAAEAPVTETRKADALGETLGTATLPPPGYGRDEALRMRQDRLQQLIQERGEQIAFGLLDPQHLKVDAEIARYYADILAVAPTQPDRMYCWVETGIRDNRPEHVHHKQMQGWKFVTCEDPECPAVPRTAEGYRRLGTTVLMWIDIERYVEIKAHEHAVALRQRGDMQSADRMVEVAARHGAQVKIIENWNQLSPEARQLAEQRFSMRQRQLQRTWEHIDQELRGGTAHLNYGNQRRGSI
jgi:hypothetical protein